MSAAPTPLAATHLLFVATAAQAPPAAIGTAVVVLDTAWTPPPGSRPDVVGIRPFLSSAIERHDLYEEALDRVDLWADAAGLVDRLTVDGITYWFRMRESLWHWLHERLLWRYALAALLPVDGFASLSVPGDEIALSDVARVLGGDVRAIAEVPPDAVAPRYSFGALGRWLDRRSASRRAGVLRGRDARMDQRVDGIRSDPISPVLILTMPAIHHSVGATAGRRADPHLGPVAAQLDLIGLRPVRIALGVNHRTDDGWAVVEHVDDLLPHSLAGTRWADRGDKARAEAAVGEVLARVDDIGAIPVDVDGVDLSSGLTGALRAELGRVVATDVSHRARIGRLVADLRPRAILLTQEWNRLPWLIVGAEAGVPTFAVQHGVLYRTHPGYPDRRVPSQAFPTRMFVYGDYERRVLLAGAYGPDEVEVSGAPRLDLDTVEGQGSDPEQERAAVRADLGVVPGDRLLVVSTLHLEFVRRSHLVHMLTRTLGGALPGVHVVFKQHPGEQDPGPYRALLEGLAIAGGYPPPAMSVVKDLDLYRLLRAADAHLGLHSTVLTDAVAAGTPNLIAMVEGHADLLGYVAAGVATPVRDVGDVRTAMAAPPRATEEARQAFLADHFRAGDASARIADSIGRVVGVVETPPVAQAIGAR